MVQRPGEDKPREEGKPGKRGEPPRDAEPGKDIEPPAPPPEGKEPAREPPAPPSREGNEPAREVQEPEETQLAQLFTLLIREAQTGVVGAALAQNESGLDFHRLVSLPDDEFMEQTVPVEEARIELARLFPSADEKLASGVSEGAPLTSAMQDLLKQRLDLDLADAVAPDARGSAPVQRAAAITAQDEARIVAHWRKRKAQDRRASMTALLHQGIPRLLVDHGTLTVKVTFSLRPGAASRVASLAEGAAIFVRPINARSASSISGDGAFAGEVQVSYKMDVS